jgi:hypothetical protein
MKKSRLLGVVCGCIFAFITTTVNASLVVPVGLNPGDKYHVIFTTSDEIQSMSTDIAFYDAHVQAAAETAGIGASAGINWLALGSTSSVNAIDHLDSLFSPNYDAPIYTQLGDLVASSYAELWTTGPQVRINVDEYGLPPVLNQVWTGSTGAGTAAPNAELGAGITGSRYGGTTTGPTWIDSSTADSENFFHMYALSQEITVVPIPPALWLFGSGLLGLIGVVRKKAA